MKYSMFAGRLLIVQLALFSGAAMAGKDGVTEDAGFSADILLAAGYIDLENSYVAGNKLIDVKNNTISGYGSPKAESDTFPFFTGVVNYTFDNRLQAYFGSDLQDLATLDLAQNLGIRKQWDGVGVMGGSLLLSGIPGEVWEDPYLLNSPRRDTDRDSTGIEFDWWRILDSNFFLELSARDIDIKNETSGSAINYNNVVCYDACRSLLRRDGTDTRLTLGYRWKNGSSVWQPEITAGKDDRDGNAISRDLIDLKLSYSYIGDVWMTVASVAYTDSQYDKPNPIFNQRTDSDGFAASISLLRKLELGDGNWSVVGNVIASNTDSKVNFNDSSVLGVFAGVNYAFGK